MMETTDLWNGSHFAHCWRLYAARLGRVLLKRVLALFAVGASAIKCWCLPRNPLVC